jgi:hypothetical protein
VPRDVADVAALEHSEDRQQKIGFAGMDGPMVGSWFRPSLLCRGASRLAASSMPRAKVRLFTTNEGE